MAGEVMVIEAGEQASVCLNRTEELGADHQQDAANGLP